MALNTKSNATGLDHYVNRFQTEIYNELAKLLPVGFVHESYGRCYRNLVNGKYRAEVFNSATDNDYTDVLWDDSKGMVSFFGTDTRLKESTRDPMNMHMIFFVNLQKAKPSLVGRADEEVKIDLRNIIGKCLYRFHYISMETGVQTALKEYPGSIEMVEKYDQQPLHVFRINFIVHYNKNFSPTLKLS